jgi:hypothetical protein
VLFVAAFDNAAAHLGRRRTLDWWHFRDIHPAAECAHQQWRINPLAGLRSLNDVISSAVSTPGSS